MPKQLFWMLVFVAALLGSCGRGKSVIPDSPYGDDKESPIVPPPPAPYSGAKKYCFQKQEGENGANITSMQLIVDNDSVTGEMNYISAAKDTIHGQLRGLMYGKIFELVYSYDVNGKQQAEEVVYKFENNQLFKKTGDMEVKNGMLVLADPLRAKFILALEKVDCR